LTGCLARSVLARGGSALLAVLASNLVGAVQTALLAARVAGRLGVCGRRCVATDCRRHAMTATGRLPT
jgi:hypothetical protein